MAYLHHTEEERRGRRERQPPHSEKRKKRDGYSMHAQKVTFSLSPMGVGVILAWASSRLQSILHLLYNVKCLCEKLERIHKKISLKKWPNIKKAFVNGDK